MENVTGVAWYQAEEWERLREVSADADRLETSYEDWLQTAERVLRDLQRRGVSVQRVTVDVDELVAWCRAGSREVDAEARSAFVAEKLRAAYSRGERPNV